MEEISSNAYVKYKHTINTKQLFLEKTDLSKIFVGVKCKVSFHVVFSFKLVQRNFVNYRHVLHIKTTPDKSKTSIDHKQSRLTCDKPYVSRF